MQPSTRSATHDAHPRSFIGASDARITQLWCETRGEAEPEGLSGKPRPTQPCGYVRTRRSASPVSVAHAEFIGALAGHPPRPIPIDADAIDLEDRADGLE